MTMGVEYGFMLLLVVGKYLRHHCFVLFGSSWIAVARQVLTKVDENSGGFRGNLRYTTSDLVESSMYFYLQ